MVLRIHSTASLSQNLTVTIFPFLSIIPRHISPLLLLTPLPSIVSLPLLKLSILRRVSPPASCPNPALSYTTHVHDFWQRFSASGQYRRITTHVQHQSRLSIIEKLLLDTVHSWHQYRDTACAPLCSTGKNYPQASTRTGPGIVSVPLPHPHLPPSCCFPRHAYDHVSCQLEGSAPAAMPIPSTRLTLGSGRNRGMKDRHNYEVNC